MNVISWNVRGLGRPAKHFLVKDFFALHFADVCCLQESKLEEISISTWMEVGGSRINNCHFLPTRSSAGGIILGWNSQVNVGSLANVGVFSISIHFCSTLNGLC